MTENNAPVLYGAIIIGVIIWQITGDALAYYVGVLLGLVGIAFVDGYRNA